MVYCVEMNVGDVVYFEDKQDIDTGYIVADGSVKFFASEDFPELAEMYEFQFDIPDGMKTIGIPVSDPLFGLVPHIVGRQIVLSESPALSL